MKRLELSAFYILIFLIYGCNSGKVEYADINFGKPDEYSFVMQDTAMVNLAEGTLIVTHIKDSAISGKYNFSKVYKENFPGYNTMKGDFSGNYYSSSNKVFLNMNPKVSDNNVFVNLYLTKNSLAGEWTYSTLTGSDFKGNFRAYKVKQ
jgi:hypothetical protein